MVQSRQRLTTVNSGGTLTGISTVGNLQVNSGGTFAPGNGTPGSAGVPSMIVNGSLVFDTAARYMVFLNSSTSSFVNVNGTATLGGDVEVNVSSVSHKPYLILETTGGIGGTRLNPFSNPNFAGVLSYSATNAFLTFTEAELGHTTTLTVNQQNVANAIDNFFNSGGTLPPAFGALFDLTGTNLRNGLDQVSGEAATGAQQAAFQLGDQFLNVMLDPFVDGRCSCPQFKGAHDLLCSITTSASAVPLEMKEAVC